MYYNNIEGVHAHFPMTSRENPPQEEREHRGDQSQETLSQLYLAAIVESSDDAILGKTLDGIVMSWNPAAERLYGYTEQEIVGKPITTIIPKECYDDFLSIMQQLKEGKKIDHHETTRIRKDGTRVTVSVTISPIKDASGKIIGASTIARDISEQHALEQRKDGFIRIASHELKTPLTALKGITGLLQRRLAKHGDEGILPFLARMNEQLDRLTKLVNDLLDLSKIQVGKLDHREEYFDLDALVRETVEVLQETTQTHHLSVEGQANVYAFGDRDRIMQVLINLVTNALKYSPQADKVIVHVWASQEYAVLSVQDFGIGITQSHQAHIFERFYQITESEEKMSSGLGIGLYITREIVRQHHGQIWVKSQKGEGSTFYVSFPFPIKKIDLSECIMC